MEPMLTEPKVHRRLIVSCVLAAALSFGLQGLLLSGSDMDDPYIFARYARNVWRYGDLLWNPGEPRIEGFSSWLWLGVYLVGVRFMEDPVVFARIVGLSAGCLLAVSFTREVLRDRQYLTAGLGAAVVLLGSPSLAFYAMCGMDHIAWALLAWIYICWLGSASTLRWPHMVGAALGLLVRPEGFLLFVPATAVWFLEAREEPSPRRAVVSLGRLLAPAIGVIAVIAGLRFLLFGTWLPNAAAAKHFGGALLLRAVDGALYASEGIALYLAIPLIAVALVWPALGTDPGASRAPAGRGIRQVIASLSFTVALLGFTIAAGGDDTAAFGSTRLLSPAIAPAAYLLYWAMRETTAASWGNLRVVILILVILLGRVHSAKELLQDATGATNLSSPGQILLAGRDGLKPKPEMPLATYLKRHTPSGEYIAVPWAGALPFQTDLPVIDLLGLNDTTIAKAPWKGRGAPDTRYDPDYILTRRPYFICENFVVRSSPESVRNLSDEDLRSLGAWKWGARELLRHPALAEAYEIDPQAPVEGTCFRRRDGFSTGPSY